MSDVLNVRYFLNLRNVHSRNLLPHIELPSDLALWPFFAWAHSGHWGHCGPTGPADIFGCAAFGVLLCHRRPYCSFSQLKSRASALPHCGPFGHPQEFEGSSVLLGFMTYRRPVGAHRATVSAIKPLFLSRHVNGFRRAPAAITRCNHSRCDNARRHSNNSGRRSLRSALLAMLTDRLLRVVRPKDSLAERGGSGRTRFRYSRVWITELLDLWRTAPFR
jgi:hypothetical protein